MESEEGKLDLSEFLSFLSVPERSASELLWTERDTSKKLLRTVCQNLFRRIEQLAKYQRSVLKIDEGNLCSLDELFMGDEEGPVDAETLWAQVEMQNEALGKLLKGSAKKLSSAVEQGDCLQVIGDLSSDEEVDRESLQEDSDADDEDSETLRMQDRMERAMEDMEDEDTSEASSDEQVNSAQLQEEDSLEDPAAEELNDGFFDINEMVRFRKSQRSRSVMLFLTTWCKYNRKLSPMRRKNIFQMTLMARKNRSQAWGKRNRFTSDNEMVTLEGTLTIATTS